MTETPKKRYRNETKIDAKKETSPVETEEVLTIACPNEKLLTHYFKKSVILYIICRDLVQNVNIVIDLFLKEFLPL